MSKKGDWVRIDPQEEKTWPTAKRIAVLQAETDARLAALEGGDSYDEHKAHLRWLAATIWDLEHEGLR